MKHLTLWLLFLATPGLFAMQAADEIKPVILLTGFGPFQDIKVNPSWETVKLFQGKEIAGYRVETALLPVVYDELERPLLDAVKKHNPSIVIAFGVAEDDFRVETAALNGYDPQRLPDNKSNSPSRDKIVPDGPAKLKTTLPSDAIVKALKDLKIGVNTSTDAGGYLCNECFYRLMKECESVPTRGLIHVPNYGKTDPAGNEVDQALLTKAIGAIVEAVIKAQAAKSKPER